MFRVAIQWGVLAVTMMLLAIHIVADAWLGDVAEYFNLWHVLVAWWDITGVMQPFKPRFLYGQAALGWMALPLATALVIAEALITYHLLAYARRRFARSAKPDGRNRTGVRTVL